MTKRKHTEISGNEQGVVDSTAATIISSHEAVEILLTISKEPCLSTIFERFSIQLVQLLMANCCRQQPSFTDLTRFSALVSDLSQQIGKIGDSSQCLAQIKQFDFLPKRIHTLGKTYS